MNTLKPTGIDDAIALAGSQRALARLVGCTQQAVHAWMIRGYVPISRAIEIEQSTGVPRQRLINPKWVEVLDTTGV